jgi:predicted RNase H-like HicB family nuclease
MTKTKTKLKNKHLAETELLEYQVNIAFDPRDNIFVAKVPELENCHTHGITAEEALLHAKEAIELWIETAREKKIPIPPPISRRKFSGKFVIRPGESLHAALAQEALRRGTSMNDLAVEILSRGLKIAG